MGSDSFIKVKEIYVVCSLVIYVQSVVSKVVFKY